MQPSKYYYFQCNLEKGDILVHVLTWLALIVVTLGIAAIFYPYFFIRFIVNSISINQ
jgi:hypothetical protein